MAKQYRRIVRLLCPYAPVDVREQALAALHAKLVSHAELRRNGALSNADRLSVDINRLFHIRNMHAPWWQLVQEYELGYFKQDVLTQSTWPLSTGWEVEFILIKHPIGHHKRFYKVRAKHDHTLNRYFVTNSGAKSYFEHITGSSAKVRESTAQWGWKSIKELKAFLEQTIV